MQKIWFFIRRPKGQPALRQPFRHHTSADVGESEVAALEAVGQLQMVESEEVQECGLEVIHVYRAVGRMPADLIGCSPCLSTPDATTGHPQAEGERMMISPRIGGSTFAIFAQRCASEFSAPDDESGIEKTALFEVCQQCCDGLIHNP